MSEHRDQMELLLEAKSRSDLATAWPAFSTISQPVVEFYGSREKNNLFACFSNFYVHDEIPFTIPDCCWNRLVQVQENIPRTVQVAFSEKSIMLCKAAAMGDIRMYVQIMNCTRPNEAKNLGRQIQNFNECVWQSVILTVAFEAVYQKFIGLQSLGRNEHTILLQTNDALIVEAAPGDFIWGIGYPKGHPRCQDPCQWGSSNILGFALIKARRAIKERVIIGDTHDARARHTFAGACIGSNNKLPIGMGASDANKINNTAADGGKNPKNMRRKERQRRVRRRGGGNRERVGRSKGKGGGAKCNGGGVGTVSFEISLKNTMVE